MEGQTFVYCDHFALKIDIGNVDTGSAILAPASDAIGYTPRPKEFLGQSLGEGQFS